MSRTPRILRLAAVRGIRASAPGPLPRKQGKRNLTVDSRAGLLFLDRETGTALQLTGRTSIVRDERDVGSRQAAERVIEYQIEAVRERERVIPADRAFPAQPTDQPAAGTVDVINPNPQPDRKEPTMAALHPTPPFEELTYFPTYRWIRGTRGEGTIVDTRRALLVWEPGKRVPIYALPRDDVALGSSGDAREFDDPALDRYVTIDWDALDHWYEEDEEVFVHPRDPFVRVDALRSSRRVRVERQGRLLAESDSPILVFETGLPTRYYLPERDVDASALTDSDLHTGCPYKGFASYRDVVLNGRRHPNLFWYYKRPFKEVAEIEGYLAPYNERVDLVIDGELQQRPPGPLGRQGKSITRAA